MDCPRCGAFNSRSATECDCGYVFPDADGEVGRSRTKRSAEVEIEAEAEAEAEAEHELPTILLSVRRSGLAIAGMAALAVAYAGVAGLEICEALGVDIPLEGLPPLHAEEHLDHIDQLVAVVYFAAGCAFLSWLAGAIRDVTVLHPDEEFPYTPFKAVATFFVPFLNLVGPFRVMRSLRDASDPAHYPDAPTRILRREGGYRDATIVAEHVTRAPGRPAQAWFSIWVVCAILNRFAGVNGHAVARGVITLGMGVTAFLAIDFVRTVNARLREQLRRARAQESGAPEPEIQDTSDAPRLSAGTTMLVAAVFTYLLGRWSAGDGEWAMTWTAGVALGIFGGMRALATVEHRVRVAIVVAAAMLTGSNVAMRIKVIRESRQAVDLDRALVELTRERSNATLAPGQTVAQSLSPLRAARGRFDELARTSVLPVSLQLRCFADQSMRMAESRVSYLDATIEPDKPLYPAALVTPEASAATIAEARRRVDVVGHRHAVLMADQAPLRDCLSKAGLFGAEADAAMELRDGEVAAGLVDHAAAHHRLAGAVERGVGLLATARWTPTETGPSMLEPRAQSTWNGILDDAGDALRALLSAERVLAGKPLPTEPGTLAAARASFSTSIHLPPENLELPPPPGELVRASYPSPVGALAAYASRPKRDGRHPAVLWLPTEGLQIDLLAAQSLSRAGYVVMVPMARGEGKNPGNRELELGEVDDASSALAVVSSREDVDPERVVLVGAGWPGGTRAALVAGAASKVRGTIVLRAPLAVEYFPVRDARLQDREAELRSVRRFAPSLQRPLFYIAVDSLSLSLGDELGELSKGKAHALACGHGARCDVDLLVSLLGDRVAERGELSIGREDVQRATLR